jgi:hypothetical protein
MSRQFLPRKHPDPNVGSHLPPSSARRCTLPQTSPSSDNGESAPRTREWISQPNTRSAALGEASAEGFALPNGSSLALVPKQLVSVQDTPRRITIEPIPLDRIFGNIVSSVSGDGDTLLELIDSSRSHRNYLAVGDMRRGDYFDIASAELSRCIADTQAQLDALDMWIAAKSQAHTSLRYPRITAGEFPQESLTYQSRFVRVGR